MPFVTLADGRRLLFLHVPKAGGTSVETWMRSFGELRLYAAGLVPPSLKCTPQHLRHWDIEQILGAGYFDYSFALVRNPFRRMESEYRMRAIAQSKTMQPRMADFSLWLGNQMEQVGRNPFHLDNHLRPQAMFMARATRVFRFEDGIDAAISTVATEMRLPPPGPAEHAMSSAEFKGKIVWEQSDILTMRSYYKQDFEEFGYSTDP